MSDRILGDYIMDINLYNSLQLKYDKLRKEYLKICDDFVCSGDYSVGELPCPFYNEDSNSCELKQHNSEVN